MELQRSPAYELQKMRQIHHDIVNLHILHGYKQKEIAEMLGVSEAMVSYTLNSAIVQKKIGVLREALDAQDMDVAKEIRESAPLALNVLLGLLLDENAADRLRASIAQDLLDRGNYSGVTKIAHAHATVDMIHEAKQRARQTHGFVDTADAD